MSERYIYSPSNGESEMLGSRFVAYAFPCQSFEEAKRLLEEVGEANKKAAHIPYGYLGRDKEAYSEDGEPANSSGRPLLDLLRGEGICGLVAVARYFGGRKLGVGNLRRKVVEAAKAALSSCRYAVMSVRYSQSCSLPYSEFEQLSRLASRLRLGIESATYGEEVSFRLTSDGMIDPAIAFPPLRGRLGEKEQISSLQEVDDAHQ